MPPPNETARLPTKQSAPEKPAAAPLSTVPTSANGEQMEATKLLQRIVELLDDIDGSLANLGGKLDQIHERMP